MFLTRYLILQWSSNVASHYWYTWDNVSSGTFWDTINTNSSGCNGTGTALTSQQGGGWLCQPGLAYERLNQWIQGASLITNCASLTAPNGDTLWQCDLTRSTPTAGYRGRLIWDTSKTCTQGGNPACPTYTYTVPTPNPFTQYRTLDSGTAITIGSGQVPLTAKPILLENFSEF